MRKIPKELENFIDNIVIDTADLFVKPLKKFNFTPNELTTISLIMGISAAYFLYIGETKKASFLFMSAYLFDCIDGHYARTMNMCTVFGDYYDHFSDMFKYLLILYVLYIKYNDIFKKYIYVILIASGLSFVHLGCQEIYYGKDHSISLSIFKGLCPNNNNNIISILNLTKYFGVGSLMMLISTIIYRL